MEKILESWFFQESCFKVPTQRAVTCTKDVIKTRLQDVQNVNSEDVDKT